MIGIVLDVSAQDPIAAAEDRGRLLDAQVDLLAFFEKHCLGLDADVALLSTALAYLAHAHSVTPDELAFRAASPPRGDRSMH